MNGFERRKQNKIDQIYSAAFQLFSKHGFQKVSVNEIAQNAKVSPATIYNYFGTKEQLYADMLMNWMDKQLEQYERILDSGSSFPEKTKDIMLLEAKNLHTLTDELQNAPFSELSGLLQRIESEYEQKIRHFFTRFVALGKQEGYIQRDLTEEMMMMYFTMYKNELGRHWEASNRDRVTLSMEQWVDMFFFGLVGQKQK
ncbi:TetR/AcrR family transcriptional regulator [Brevibacillus sp. M2.1A]|uniref:TetR/AcrR family transcriptional regulator n=1 Tax=Brevibacillus TaxID=55080 RepID=UPI00156BA9F5|nr:MULTISPECIES: TetR/AcrR family transcriptional regulator [Brevibacillus]MBY0087766.1 TetR/AcrR family transcriptional regulator [Brevibacillus brevis]MCC8433409.1 TetR/AcrR family transcriptional regulator [Brevibacillus sp. M2.1A]MCE0450662.1 TetR/AcrR family transcriptional regulator [Brevibacillus sp. AF8]UKL01125.1 TetR/AcrR family transcriptional regulator [Brevibacillus brevis]